MKDDTVFPMSISVVIETLIVSEYVSGKLYLPLDLLTVKFSKDKFLPSGLLTASAGGVS